VGRIDDLLQQHARLDLIRAALSVDGQVNPHCFSPGTLGGTSSWTVELCNTYPAGVE
jgi:hypothetical protein